MHGSGSITPPLLYSGLDGEEWSDSHICQFTRGEITPDALVRIKDWLGPRPTLDIMEKRNIFYLCQKPNPVSSDVQSVA
jgi:hypothetical protein